MERLLLSRTSSIRSYNATQLHLRSSARLIAMTQSRTLATHAPIVDWTLHSQLEQHKRFTDRHPASLPLGAFTSNAGPSEEPAGRRPSKQENLANFGETLEAITSHLPHLLQEGHLPIEILADNVALEFLPATMTAIGPIPLPRALQVPFPEIRGISAYLTVSRIGCWCVNLLFGASTAQPSSSSSSISTSLNSRTSPLSLVIDKQQLLGSNAEISEMAADALPRDNRSMASMLNERLEPSKHKLIVRFRLVATDSTRRSAAQETTLTTGLFHFHFDNHGKVARHVLEVLEQRHSRARHLARSWGKLWWAAAVRAAKRTALGKKEPALGLACAGQSNSRRSHNRSK